MGHSLLIALRQMHSKIEQALALYSNASTVPPLCQLGAVPVKVWVHALACVHALVSSRSMI